MQRISRWGMVLHTIQRCCTQWSELSCRNTRNSSAAGRRILNARSTTRHSSLWRKTAWELHTWSYPTPQKYQGIKPEVVLGIGIAVLPCAFPQKHAEANTKKAVENDRHSGTGSGDSRSLGSATGIPSQHRNGESRITCSTGGWFPLKLTHCGRKALEKTENDQCARVGQPIDQEKDQKDWCISIREVTAEVRLFDTNGHPRGVDNGKEISYGGGRLRSNRIFSNLQQFMHIIKVSQIVLSSSTFLDNFLWIPFSFLVLSPSDFLLSLLFHWIDGQIYFSCYSTPSDYCNLWHLFSWRCKRIQLHCMYTS